MLKIQAVKDSIYMYNSDCSRYIAAYNDILELLDREKTRASATLRLLEMFMVIYSLGSRFSNCFYALIHCVDIFY